MTNPVRTLHVTREANGGLGYLWHVTFTTLPSGSAGYTTAAYGDVPALVPSKTLLTASNGGTLDVLNMATGATGSRPNGATPTRLLHSVCRPFVVVTDMPVQPWFTLRVFPRTVFIRRR